MKLSNGGQITLIVDACWPDTAKWVTNGITKILRMELAGNDEVNRKLDTAPGLSRKFSGLKGLVPVESTVPKLCPTPGCPVWFGQHEEIQEGC